MANKGHELSRDSFRITPRILIHPHCRARSLLRLVRATETKAAAWEATVQGRAVYDSTLGVEEGCRLYEQLLAAQDRGLSMHSPTALLFTLIKVHQQDNYSLVHRCQNVCLTQ